MAPARMQPQPYPFPRSDSARAVWRYTSTFLRGWLRNKAQSVPASDVVRVIRQLRHCQGLAEVEALGIVGTQAGDQCELVCCLDTFRRDAEAQDVAEVDNGAHDRPGRCIGRQVCDEVLSDLDDVERELAKVAERGVSGPEVVQ